MAKKETMYSIRVRNDTPKAVFWFKQEFAPGEVIEFKHKDKDRVDYVARNLTVVTEDEIETSNDESDPEGFRNMTKAQLLVYAEEIGVDDVDERSTKKVIIDSINAILNDFNETNPSSGSLFDEEELS